MAEKPKRRRKTKGERSGALGFIMPLVLGVISLILLFDMDYNVLPFLDIGGASEPFHTVLLVLVVLAFIWFALRFLGFLLEIVAGPRMGSYAAVRSSWKTVSYTIWAVVLTFIFFFFMGGGDSLVLSLGLIGAALAFVLQKPLLNILGWMFISYNRMFKIGDRIDIGGVKGFVTDINLMHTDVYEMEGWMKGETFTGRISQIPNGMIFDGAVNNYTRDSPYIWDEVGNLVTYESNIDRAKQHMLDAANGAVGELMTKKHEAYRKRLELHDLDRILPSQPTIRMDLADSGVNLYVVYWACAEDRREVRSLIVEAIWRKFSEDPEVEIAYPHMQIVKNEK